MSNWWQVDNLTFPVTRARINSILEALFTHNSASDLESDADNLLPGALQHKVSDDTIHYRNATNDAWVQLATVLSVTVEIHPPVGSTLNFVNDSVGTGWTLVHGLHDRVPLCRDDGGNIDAGGSWYVSGLSNSHVHGGTVSGNTTAASTGAGTSGGAGDLTHISHYHSVVLGFVTGDSSNGAIFSDQTWRPSYYHVKVFRRTS